MNTLPKIYVLGTGGLAKETAQLIIEINQASNTWSFEGYVSNGKDDVGLKLPYGTVVETDESLLRKNVPFAVVIAVGDPYRKKKIYELYCEKSHVAFPSLVHPTAIVDSKYVKYGIGNVVCRGVQITCDVKIGNFNLFNLNSTVGHDVDVGSFNVINPSVNISGGVVLGNEILVGTGAQILEGRKIFSGSTVGAGAVVARHIESKGVWVGVPARSLRS